MSVADKQIAVIRRAQANTFAEPADDIDIVNQVAFMIETTNSVSEDVVVEAAKSIAELNWTAEQLFPGDPEHTAFLLNCPLASFNDLPGSPFDLAYRLETVDLFSIVEPDLETNFHAVESPDWPPASMPLSKSFGSLCESPNPPDPKRSDLGWVLRCMNVDQARARHHVSGDKVTIAHIDTGIAKHIDTDNIDVQGGINLIEKKLPGAWDPLRRNWPWDNPGHGTATASVIISEGGLTSDTTTGPGRISGVAPKAKLFPIRAIRTVIRLRQSTVTKAIHTARKRKVDIITMSLAGLPSFFQWLAVKKAVKENIIVLGAAGNCVRTVAWPARFDDCIAVAGVTKDFKPWRGTCRGKAVDFSAPGEFVWSARQNEKIQDRKCIYPAQGTSFAVALTAGVAALWLEKHGKETLRKSLAPGDTVQERFRRSAIETVTKVPDLPTDKMGAGVLNALDLMDVHDTPPGVQLMAAKPDADAPTWGAAALSLLTAQDDPSDAEMDFAKGLPDNDALESVSLEIIWRTMIEAKRRVSSKELSTLPPVSERLEEQIKANPLLADLTP